MKSYAIVTEQIDDKLSYSDRTLTIYKVLNGQVCICWLWGMKHSHTKGTFTKYWPDNTTYPVPCGTVINFRLKALMGGLSDLPSAVKDKIKIWQQSRHSQFMYYVSIYVLVSRFDKLSNFLFLYWWNENL
jgi:hypothetical protein